MNKNDFLNSGLVEQYVLGLTDEEETLLVEQYMQKHPDIKLQVKTMQSGLMQYARTYTRDALQGKNTNSTDIPVFGNTSGTGRGAFNIATILVVALLFVLGLSLFRTGEQPRQFIASVLPAIRNADTPGDSIVVYRNGEALDSKLHPGDLFKHPSTQPVVLKGTPKYPACEGVIYYNDQTRQCFLQLQRFPATPESGQLQVWADVNGILHHAGLIKSHVNRFQELRFIDRAMAFNISLQTEEGSEIPDLSEIYASGQLIR